MGGGGGGGGVGRGGVDDFRRHKVALCMAVYKYNQNKDEAGMIA